MSALAGAPRQRRSYTEIKGQQLQQSPWLRTFKTALLPILRRAGQATWRYLQQGSAMPMLKRKQRRLRVCETLSLGDKRFVSILEVDGQSFLVGGSGTSMCLLASLAPEPAPAFARVLNDSLQRDGVQ